MRRNVVLFLTVIIFIAACKKQNHLTVSTVAGSGLMGPADGNGTEASFSNLMGLCLDEKGNIYVADSRNNKIRKVDPEGTVTTIAGGGAPGSKDGKGAAASFFDPAAVATDKNGNVYVADKQNNLIRKISPDGMVTTIAGRWEKNEGYGGKYPVFDYPTGITADSAGNIYVADSFHDKIRKIGPDGKITILAGNGNPGSNDGTGTSASFFIPEGIAADAKGNLYVADTYNNMIRKISPDGKVVTVAGKTTKGAANGKGNKASFFHPIGLAVDKAGNIYVADSGNNMIRKISPDGTVTTLAGSTVRGSKNGNIKEALFYKPMGIALDKQNNIYVADFENNLVRKISN